jgi:hypothetical protein
MVAEKLKDLVQNEIQGETSCATWARSVGLRFF